jgi:hypothetical protein
MGASRVPGIREVNFNEISDGVTVYESIEKIGLTTELVSAVNGSSLTEYITSKGLNLPESSKSILDEYTGKEYSFVISWISDIEKFKQEQGRLFEKYTIP